MEFITSLLLKLLGVKAPAGTSIVHQTVTWHGVLSWGWLLFIVLCLGVATVLSYRRTGGQISPVRRYTMAGLRILFFFLLLLILMRPVLSLTLQGSVRRTLVVMVDGTLSMETADPRAESPDDLQRAAIAKGLIDPAKGLHQQLPAGAAASLGKVTRLDMLKSVLTNPKMALLSRLSKEYDLRIYSFGHNSKTQRVTTEVTPASDKLVNAGANGAPATDKPDDSKPLSLDWVKLLPDDSVVTPIGDATREVVDDTRGLPRAGIIIATDGGNNSGVDPLNVAQNLSAQEGENLPIYTYGIGMTSPKDVIVVDMVADPFCFIKEETGVTVRVRGQNVNGQGAPLQLFLVDDKNNAIQVDSRDVTFGPDGDQVISLKFTPKVAGDFMLRAYIPPLPNEASITNNVVEQHLRVLDKKINILLVERQPRWEYENLMSQLLRDRRVDLKVVLFDGDPDIASAPNSPFLAKFPERKELFKYDAVILGDVDPHSLSESDMNNLLEFVSKFGGGFMMIAGRGFAPNAYRGTPIEKLIPVDLDMSDGGAGLGAPSAEFSSGSAGSKPIQLDLTDKGLHSPMLELSDKSTENAEIWHKLPPIYWDARVGKAKEGAEVLLQDPDDAKANGLGRMPVLVLGHYGGNLIYVGTDNTWRWRKNHGEEYYIRFWNQMVLRVALPHLLGFSKRTQLKCDKEGYVAERDRVTIDASIYDQNYQPVTKPEVTGYYGNGNARDATSTNNRPVTLKADPSQPGHYTGQFLAPAAGSYKFHVDDPGDPTVFLDFTTSTPTTEQGDTAMNETLLRDMSKATGGRFFREEDLYKLPDDINATAEKVFSTQEKDLWSTPLFFLLILSVVAAEWILRKFAQLK